MKKLAKRIAALAMTAAMMTASAGAITQDGQSETWFDGVWALIDAFGLKAEHDPYVLQNYINKYLEKLMAKHNVNIDIILQSVGRDNKKSISFTIRQDDAERVEKILRDAKEMLGYEDISINTKVAKVSIVGAGMASATGVASKMFEALASAGINIRMISTSEIKISVLINEEDSEKAVKAIHEEFFNA